MIYETLGKHKHVLTYDQTAPLIEQSTIEKILKKTWKVTPSKNNIMAYNVYVLGPEHQHYKEIIYDISSKNEDRTNKRNPIPDTDKTNGRIPAYSNLLNCQYLLIFTLRLGGPLNPYQQRQWNRGVCYDPCLEEGLIQSCENIAVECGLFANTFRGLCVEEGIDTSFTANFSKDIDDWKEIPFINRRVMLLMTVGYAKVYREDMKLPPTEDYIGDVKPDYDRIVKFIE